MGRLNLAIFISGRGSNMEALVRACEDPDFPARVSVVISNRSDALGLEKAQAMGIPTEAVDHKMFPDRESFDAALQETLNSYPVDLICLAGFMRLLTADFVNTWERRILNIHPSLLPAYKGLKPQAQALADGATESGCTVHIVIPELDAGPSIVQKRVPILPDDTEETLTARIFEQEHSAYPEAVRVMAERLEKKNINSHKKF